MAADADFKKRYIASLKKEIEAYKGERKIAVDTVFIGGGTPSILSGELFEALMESVRESFDVTDGAEITVEVNPKTLDDEKIKTYKECGVNRISIGLQSIHENELKILGRIHSYSDFLNTYNALRSSGFDNINVDLMYGIPEQTVKSFEKTLDTVISLNPNHISCYGLIVEEGTPFYENREILPFPDEDSECDMYELAHEKFTCAGYSHYEISNYAREKSHCRHNLKYWRDEEYIGVGLAAHSYFNGVRFFNTSDFLEYFEGPLKYRGVERSSKGKDSLEYAMLALRLSEGLSLSEYRRIFGKEFADGKKELLKFYIERGFMELENERLRFTYKGFYVSNAILSELL
jgi:oxygen-independent coproporphyrinogen-3 oxidase